MRTERKKALLLSLILDDLVHAQLVEGLISQGIKAEYYAHDVPFAVMELMGFDREQQERVFPLYRQWQLLAADVDISRGNHALRRMAQNIYKKLEELKHKMPARVAA